MEGIGNPEELRERFEVSNPPAEQPQRAGILGLKKDLNTWAELGNRLTGLDINLFYFVVEQQWRRK